MFEKRHILPIFLLYFLTSTAFLLFFGRLFYERERHFIMDEARFELKELRREFQIKLHENGELTAADFAQHNASVLNVRTGEIIKRDFDVDFKLARGLAVDYFHEGSLVAQFRMHSRGRTAEYIAFVKGENLEPKFRSLKLQILLISLGVLAAILLIAYFIVRLSLRPLYEKIEFLDGFLRDTTHEINTPISVILMSAELFKSDPEKYLSNIKTAAATLSNLYEDLVALKFNKTAAAPELVDVSAMIDERIEYFSAALAQKGINLRTDIDECELVTDKFKLRKIIDNLLSNALKYSDEGGNIKINLTPKELSIANSGEGIAAKNLPHIFELYTRFDRRNGGLGVGLNLVKKFCDELGFDISCVSEHGWTEFEVKFNSVSSN